MKMTVLSALLAFIWLSLSASAQDTSKGKASYYSDRLHGRKMSDGTPYHKDSMTCAHLKFPLGTLLKVRNPINKKEVIVKVTDRGPFTKRFIIDLSRAAARELDIINSGFTQVEITPYHKNEIPYKAEDDDLEIPELDLQYTPAAAYPDPAWQRDSTSSTPPPNVRRSEDNSQKTDTIGSGH